MNTVLKTIGATAVVMALIANPGRAGGPVIVEETEVAPAHDRKIGGLVIGLIAIAALIALSNGSDTCTTEEVPVEPEQPSGGC